MHPLLLRFAVAPEPALAGKKRVAVRRHACSFQSQAMDLSGGRMGKCRDAGTSYLDVNTKAERSNIYTARPT